MLDAGFRNRGADVKIWSDDVPTEPGIYPVLYKANDSVLVAELESDDVGGGWYFMGVKASFSNDEMRLNYLFGPKLPDGLALIEMAEKSTAFDRLCEIIGRSIVIPKGKITLEMIGDMYREMAN